MGGPRSYTVIGLGAIGGFYGARLAAAGIPVRFLARSGAEEVRREGLHVTSPAGDVHLQDVEVYERPEAVPPADVVLVTVKTIDNDAVLPILPALVTEGTVVVALQNGLDVEAPIAEAVPGSPVLGGMAFICSNREAPGRIRHLDFGSLTFGHHTTDGSPGGITPAVDAVASDFEQAGLAVQRVESLAVGRWRKLVWNIAYNGLSVVLDAGTDELMADPGTRRLVTALMEEVLAGARACGHHIEDEFVDYMLRTTDKMTPYDTSMKLDYAAGRPLELDAIYAAPIRASRRAGYEMARAQAVLDQLSFLDRRRRGVDLLRMPPPT